MVPNASEEYVKGVERAHRIRLQVSSAAWAGGGSLSRCLMLPQGMALLCMARPLEDCTVETQSDWGYSLGVGEWKGATGHILGREIDPLMEESAR